MPGIDQILSNKPGQNYRDLKKATYHIFKREGGKVWLKFVHSLLPNSTFINLVSSISLLLPHTLQTWNIIVEGCEKVGLKLNIQKIKIIASGCITSWHIDGETMETVTVFFGGGLQNHCRWWLQPWNWKMLTPWKESYDQHRQHIKKQRHYFVNKSLSSQGCDFSSTHVWMWELDYKENWALKNWCFWLVVFEKTLESPSDCKEIQAVNPKGNQSWAFIGRTDVEAEAPIFWPPDAKSWLIWKDPDVGKDWRQEKKELTEDKMVGWHHRLNGHEFE